MKRVTKFVELMDHRRESGVMGLGSEHRSLNDVTTPQKEPSEPNFSNDDALAALEFGIA